MKFLASLTTGMKWILVAAIAAFIGLCAYAGFMIVGGADEEDMTVLKRCMRKTREMFRKR